EGADREPVYQGRALSDWIDQYYWHLEASNSRVAPSMKPVWATNRSEAMAAVKQMGTNALPALFDMLRYGNSRRVRWGEWSYGVWYRTAWLDWVPRFITRRYFLPPGVAEIKHEYGQLGLEMLGPIAKPALQKALTEPNIRVRETATNLLAKMP
ncbi:MAG TPA: hypothetical protein VG754_07505, partial [Verrucomicrobiae bacterium]|nr:hypothetical protein [Verrucomicrobiae bacterium]